MKGMKPILFFTFDHWLLFFFSILILVLHANFECLKFQY